MAFLVRVKVAVLSVGDDRDLVKRFSPRPPAIANERSPRRTSARCCEPPLATMVRPALATMAWLLLLLSSVQVCCEFQRTISSCPQLELLLIVGRDFLLGLQLRN